jgi:hypothetical protein
MSPLAAPALLATTALELATPRIVIKHGLTPDR